MKFKLKYKDLDYMLRYFSKNSILDEDEEIRKNYYELRKCRNKNDINEDNFLFECDLKTKKGRR